MLQQLSKRGQSVVIGVLLLVAITIILSVVIATAVFDIGQQTSNVAPQSAFEFEQTTGTFEDGGGDSIRIIMLTVVHRSGENIRAQNVQIQVNGRPAYGIEGTDPPDAARPTGVTLWETGDIAAGDRARVAFSADESYTPSAEDISTASEANVRPVYLPDQQLEPGDTIRVIYNTVESDSAAVLAEYEVADPSDQF